MSQKIKLAFTYQSWDLRKILHSNNSYMRNLLDPKIILSTKIDSNNLSVSCRGHRISWLSQPKCFTLYGEMLGQLWGWPYRRKWVTHSAVQWNFLHSVLNGSPIFARKCRKCWFAQSSLGRRVCLLPMTTFLHINALHGVYVVVPGHHTSAESLNSSSSPSPGGLFFITSWSSLSVLSSGMKNRWSTYFVTMYFFLSSLSERKNICH